LGGILTVLCLVAGILIFRRRSNAAAAAELRQPLSGCAERGAP
jgi:hypothetical protein